MIIAINAVASLKFPSHPKLVENGMWPGEMTKFTFLS